MRFSAKFAGAREGEKFMKNRRFRLVLECVILATELVRLAIVLLNVAFNYLGRESLGSQVVNQV
jgi:hypothetical protein